MTEQKTDKTISPKRDRWLKIHGLKYRQSPSTKEKNSLPDQFEVQAGYFFDPKTGEDIKAPDYARATLKPNGHTPFQRVNREQPIEDFPTDGNGVCISFRPDTNKLRILHFDSHNWQNNQLITLKEGNISIEDQGLYPSITHQSGDYIIWLSGDRGLTLWDICQEKPYEPDKPKTVDDDGYIGDLTDLLKPTKPENPPIPPDAQEALKSLQKVCSQITNEPPDYLKTYLSTTTNLINELL